MMAPETPTEDPPQRDSVWRTSGSQEPRPPDRKDGGAKTYSRMLRELPKTLPPPVNVKELVEAKETKKKAPKKRMPIEASIMDLAFMPASRSRRSGQQDDGAPTSAQRSTTRRLVKPVRAIGNRLDSSVLVHKRGKERTKKKKPSLLKRVILRERAERRRRAGLEAAASALFAGLSVREVEREVPLVFALKRRALGHACKKPVPVSCVGIFNYQGSEDNYKRLMQLTEAAQERYRAMVADVERALRPPPPQEELSPSEKLLGSD
ncbi:Selenocysteine insertion sequence-binding protein 2-like [Amphibalanus amphitrite]|uniref:Selenocysteine insertion sequence-binding protein 2-like n=1 Tax=Amphibalanus amphitrite TaxID=1232801 RepID=A0A6A4VQH5_AMPAM|nr:Selenocysteine insertion sequence-binding protein 2-like [Amphibalanus amphitrite]